MKTDEVKTFSFSIGGYPGPYFYFELNQETLSCEYSPDTDTPSQTVLFSVGGSEKWNQLLTFLSTRKWKAGYGDPLTIDGTAWQLTLIAGNHSINSEGLNGYPPGFTNFLRLLNFITKEKGITVS